MNMYVFFFLLTPLYHNFLTVPNHCCRISSVMMTRLMLNLRDPSLITVPTRTATEDLTNPNLTFVESHYPTMLSDRGDFVDRDFGQESCHHHSYEGLEAVDNHQPTSKSQASLFGLFLFSHHFSSTPPPPLTF